MKRVDLTQEVKTLHLETNLGIKAGIRLMPTMKILATIIIGLVALLVIAECLVHSHSQETSKRYHSDKYLGW